jgi:hypothetical protein
MAVCHIISNEHSKDKYNYFCLSVVVLYEKITGNDTCT